MTVPMAALAGLSLVTAGRAQQPTVARASTQVATPVQDNPLGMSVGLQKTITAMMQDKSTWSATQQKVDSHFIYAARVARGQQPIPGVAILPTYVLLDKQGRTEVEIHAKVSPSLLAAIRAVGGTVAGSYPEFGSVSATLPLLAIEQIAERGDVMTIERVFKPRDNHHIAPNSAAASRSGLRPMVPYRRLSKSELRARVERLLIAAGAIVPHVSTGLAPLLLSAGSVDSEGDTTHNAILARSTYNVSGAGLKIGVLSDGDYHLAASEASGDLPSDVVIANDTNGVSQDGPSTNQGEGTAMMEIIHDLAPGAKLFFATAFTSESSFAQNILTLRNTYGCDIVCDDVFYLDEPPFEDGPVGQAVDQVTAGGGLYFSSAGNQGHLATNGSAYTASVFEGDFNSSGVTVTSPPDPSNGATVTGEAHNFGTAASPVLYNTAQSNLISGTDNNGVSSGTVFLFWADPFPVQTNEYDLYSTSSDGTTLDDYSNYGPGHRSVQGIYVHKSGNRIYVTRNGSSAKLALHLNGYGNGNGPAMSVVTNGQTHGHSSAPNAFSVAAAPAINNSSYPFGGPYPGQFTSSSPSEYFSSDGPRRVFFNQDDSAITPGNFLFSTNGGKVLLKPEITAADGVMTSFPSRSEFNPFFGTSAAAPHAAAIGALVKSYAVANDSSIPGLTINGPLLTVSEMRSALISSTIDIGPSGFDNISGNGIVMPIPAIQFLRSFLPVGSITAATQSATGATITWNTNLPAGSTVNYGTTTSLGSTATNSGAGSVTSHTVTLTGLQPSTLYYYQVVSATPTASASYSAPASAYQTFVTSPSQTKASLAVTGFSASTTAGVVTVALTIINRGTAPANSVQVTTASLGGVSTTSSLPFPVGGIAAGTSAVVSLTFTSPGSGTTTILRASGSDSASDTFSFSSRMKVP